MRNKVKLFKDQLEGVADAKETIQKELNYNDLRNELHHAREALLKQSGSKAALEKLHEFLGVPANSSFVSLDKFLKACEKNSSNIKDKTFVL